MTYMGLNFIYVRFDTKHHMWRWVHYITHVSLLATQISYFAPQQCYGEVRETQLEGVFRIYSGSLLRHSVAVIATCSPPPRWDLASCRTMSPCAIWLPILDVFQQWCKTKMSIDFGWPSCFWGSAWWRCANLHAHRVFPRTTIFTRAIQTRD